MIIGALVVIVGCSSGGSSSGSSSTPTPTPPQTDTEKLVGTWNFVRASDGSTLGPLVFKADGTGTFSGTAINSGKVTNGVFNFKLPSGDPEAFDCTFSNSNNTITLTNHNGGIAYTYNRAS